MPEVEGINKAIPSLFKRGLFLPNIAYAFYLEVVPG